MTKYIALALLVPGDHCESVGRQLVDCRVRWGEGDGTCMLGRVVEADEEGEEAVVDSLLLQGVYSVKQGGGVVVKCFCNGALGADVCHPGLQAM